MYKSTKHCQKVGGIKPTRKHPPKAQAGYNTRLLNHKPSTIYLPSDEMELHWKILFLIVMYPNTQRRPGLLHL